MDKSKYFLNILLITAFVSLSCNKHNAKYAGFVNAKKGQEAWLMSADSILKTLNNKYFEYIDEKQDILDGYQSKDAEKFNQKLALLLKEDFNMIPSEFRDYYWIGMHATDKYEQIRKEIMLRLFQLWEVTGRCLYLDIPCFQLLDNIPEISERYREFINNKENTPRKVLIQEGIESDIEALKTEYCDWSIEILQNEIYFDGIIMSSGNKTDCYCDEMKEAVYEEWIETYYLWNKWYSDNKDSFLWNDKKERYEHYQKGAFYLPGQVW